MGKKSDRRISTSDTSALTSNPFAALAGDGAGAEPALEEQTSAGPEPSERSSATPARAVIRYERKGRGGKEVCVVELRGADAGERERWLALLKRELGCGGFLEGEHLVLSGDQRKRLREILRREGVGKISG